MGTIGIIFSLIVAVIGGVIASSVTIIPPTIVPIPPAPIETETAQVSEIEMVDYANHDYEQFSTVASVENNDVDYHIPDNAYDIAIEQDDDRTSVFYTVDNDNDNQCKINSVYYTNGTAASSMNCDTVQ